MKKLLALTIALLMIFSLCLVSCDTVIDEDAIKDLEEKNESIKDAIQDIDGYTPDKENNNHNGGNNGGNNDDRKDDYYDDNKDDYYDDNKDDYYDDNNDNDEPSTNDKGGLEELNGKTPEQLYAQASQKINSVDNLTMIANQDIYMTMEQNGETMEQAVKQSIVQKYNGNDFSLVTQNEMGSGQMNCQYVDGMVYNVQFTDGRRIKYEATPEQLYEKLNMDPSESKVLTIPVSWFNEDVAFFEDEDNDRYYIEFSLDGDQYELLFDNMAALGNAGIDEVSDVKHRVYFTKDGDLQSMISEASMQMESQGIKVDCRFVTTTIFTNIGSTVVEVPVNADSYMLVDISQLA